MEYVVLNAISRNMVMKQVLVLKEVFEDEGSAPEDWFVKSLQYDSIVVAGEVVMMDNDNLINGDSWIEG